MKKILSNSEKRKNYITYLIVIVAYAIMQTLASFGLLSSSMKSQLVPICVYVVLAVSLNLVVGISGELSLGHAGFMGVGAFTGAVVAGVLRGSVDNEMLRLLLIMIAGGLLAGFAGFLIGMPVMRLRGDYLAIVTLAFGEILKNIIGQLYIGYDSKGLHLAFVNSDKIELAEGGKMLIDGAMGATGITKLSSFTAGILLVLFTLFVVLNLVDSKEGRAIKAIRDNRIAAESVGLNVTAFRMKAFVVSAILAGMAGALYAMNYSTVAVSKFGFNTSINILVYVVMGGMGNILGSVISATLLYVLPESMDFLEDYRMILYAVVLIVLMLCTWSPAVKGMLQRVKVNLQQRMRKNQKEDGNNG